MNKCIIKREQKLLLEYFSCKTEKACKMLCMIYILHKITKTKPHKQTNQNKTKPIQKGYFQKSQAEGACSSATW